MDSFEGKIAIVTGGASGMGRELVRQLAAEGCHVATCDLSFGGLAETLELASAGAPEGTKITTHLCDVSREAQMSEFRDAVLAVHECDHVNLVFNNAGIGGGGSFVNDSREAWERTFDVCWGGVYFGTRVFLPLLIAADEGWLVNTSSVNGLLASMGRTVPNSAYSSAKFAVRGFTESLITDLRISAPHVGVSVVMPGHIGTAIVANSARLGAEELDDEGLAFMDEIAKGFENSAPMTAAEAATVILDGVREGRWRILVGKDAEQLDEVVRAEPEGAYDRDYFTRLFDGLTSD